MSPPPELDAFSETLVLTAHRELFHYWRSIFPDSGLPGRQHFDPTDIPHLLRMLFLVDIDRNGEKFRFRYRLLGTDITSRAGRDMTGRWMEDCFPKPEAFGAVEKDYIEIIESGIPHSGRFNILAPGREHIVANRLVLPLARDGQTIDMFLGMWVYDDEASVPPERQ